MEPDSVGVYRTRDGILLLVFTSQLTSAYFHAKYLRAHHSARFLTIIGTLGTEIPTEVVWDNESEQSTVHAAARQDNPKGRSTVHS